MNTTNQAPTVLGASNPFVRAYNNLFIERLLLITYGAAACIGELGT